VCRDFAHLAVTLCRALNIPARYAFGYLPDIDVPVPPQPMDFFAWMERVLVARGRDALDVAMVSTYGGPELTSMTVWADQVIS